MPWGGAGGAEAEPGAQGTRGTVFTGGPAGHTLTHSHTHTRGGCHPRDGHSRAGSGGHAGWGVPSAPMAHTALGSGWEGQGLPSSELESSCRTGGHTREKVPGHVPGASVVTAATPRVTLAPGVSPPPTPPGTWGTRGNPTQ